MECLVEGNRNEGQGIQEFLLRLYCLETVNVVYSLLMRMLL
jgi:hypothetical protein